MTARHVLDHGVAVDGLEPTDGDADDPLEADYFAPLSSSDTEPAAAVVTARTDELITTDT